MLRHSLLTALFLLCVFLTCTTASAQNLCPLGTPSDKLICLIPQVYGVNGLLLTGSPSASSSSQFQTNFLGNSLSPVSSAIGKQSAFLPLASPSSGLTFTWDPTAKVFVPSTDSFGPILGERAETIGRNRVFIAFGYQYIKFDRLDGVSLRHLPVVFTQLDDSVDFPPRICSVNGDNTTQCAFIRDVIKTDNRLDLKIHQFTTFVTYGLTNRIDVSMIVPIENVRMGIFSNATIVDNSQTTFHTFTIQQGICGSVSVDSMGNLVVVPCLNSSFSNVRSASGIADIILRVKGTAWKGERAALALGVEVRMPTGDQLNFLGTGAFGAKPFIVWSYRSRISPHVLVGYETNGSSVLAGDTSTGRKERLPGQLTYSGGADVWLTKWLTGAFDVVGQQVFEARRTSLTQFKELGACTQPFPMCSAPFDPPKLDLNLSQSTETFNMTNLSIGVKARPVSNLLVTGNVLVRVNRGGLRANAIPFVGVSYTF